MYVFLRYLETHNNEGLGDGGGRPLQLRSLRMHRRRRSSHRVTVTSVGMQDGMP